MTEPARRWSTVLIGVMLLSLVFLVGGARAADALAATEGRYSLATSFSMSGEGSLSISADALQEAEATPLSRAEAEAVEEAIGRLDRICSSEPEAAELLFAARPERALRLMGHRASVRTLAPKVSRSNTAAMAAVEVSLAAAAE